MRILAILLFALATELVPIQAASPRSGEAMAFDVYWIDLLVGKIAVSNLGIRTRGGQECLQVETHARTTGGIEKIYKAQFKFLGYLTPNGKPWLYEEWEKEDRWELDSWIEISPHEGLVRRYNRKGLRGQIETPEGTWDPVGAGVHFLQRDLKIGEHFELPVTDGKDVYTALGEVMRGPVLETIFGKSDTLEIAPRLLWKGNPVGKRTYKIWLTADGRSIPVKIFVDIEFGSFSANLVRYRPPAEGPTLR